MSDLEALYIFLNKPVTSEMIHYLVATTTSIIQVQPQEIDYNNQRNTYPTPPNSPIDSQNRPIPSLYTFIYGLIKHSNVQSTTLMTCLVYLNRLKQVIPPNSVGMYSTHHRIFLGAMLIAAKYTNDSSPMNKHWSSYTNGLLTLREVNALEIEMIQYIGWDNLRFQNDDLIYSLSYFLEPIKRKLRYRNEQKIEAAMSNLKRSDSISNLNSQLMYSANSSISQSSTSSSLPSLISASSSTSTVSSYVSSTNLNSLPRKDSVQSIASVESFNSVLPPSSPVIINDSISIPLRPLRLKPKNYQLQHGHQEKESIQKSINHSLNIPISRSNSSRSVSIKHSRKSLKLVNLNNNLLVNEKENMSSDATDNINQPEITIVT